MNEYTIAEILHYAADKKLASNSGQYWQTSESYNATKEKYSCCAVQEAIRDLYQSICAEEYHELTDRIFTGLNSMGCQTNSVELFNDSHKFVPENQQVRYTWLKFAAIIAEEQGV